MPVFNKMPRPVLVLEACGGITLVLSYLALHQMLPLPAVFSGKLPATVLFLIAIALMLPAATAIAWRTAKAICPELFAVRNRPTPGDKHDTDY
ncbi:YbjC family protein [Erwinia psidii]|uniref:DUF1418 family protein n=1 Tax=Erwinia psidii TaxID=69224 RepID=A0A3N6TSK2_9GAMM|nr:YbjC family protein [Erwinia psidii]MCX8957340.1 DUF1418 family protein [Erwinia psidii]MCX8959710.1 DUF1418 family protein [Erwinia psidii]MCX8964653.1 DUF1418 family protein [Erwinia psidii]RQM38232.1 DUF1418 family protein [Erwinia psidii]